MSPVGIRSLILAVQEVDLFCQNDLKVINNYNQADRVQKFWCFQRAPDSAFSSPSGMVYDNIKVFEFIVNCSWCNQILQSGIYFKPIINL